VFADLGCTEEGTLSEFIDYGFFTSYILTAHVSETQSLSIFRIASFKTNESVNDIYAEVFMFGRRKAEDWDRYCLRKLHSALHFNTCDSKIP
jgi:hypothetical protein